MNAQTPSKFSVQLFRAGAVYRCEKDTDLILFNCMRREKVVRDGRESTIVIRNQSIYLECVRQQEWNLNGRIADEWFGPFCQYCKKAVAVDNKTKDTPRNLPKNAVLASENW
jgi:hypothetical protein